MHLFTLKNFILIFLILTFAGPLWILLNGKIDLKTDWRFANRDSSQLAPNPLDFPQAVVQVYSARTYSWRGVFAVHTWIATKATNAKQYTVYQVIGWRVLRNLPALMTDPDIPDRNWFGQKPTIIYSVYGNEAEQLIPQIAKAATDYPYPNRYDLWPGPNSNTFTAFIARQVPDMRLALPSIAIGKDYLPDLQFFARAPSGTGYQFSVFGIFGILIAAREGLEINILGLVYGFSPMTMTLKLPGFGDIRF